VDLSVVVPVLDERDCIEELLGEIERACDAIARSWEVVFVDDGSTDGSSQLLERLAAEHTNVGVVSHRRNFGKAAALTTGFDYAAGDVIVTLDGDGQDDPAEIPALVEELETGGWDLVCGWKHQRRDPAEKRWPSRLFNRTTARLSGLPLHDFNCGFKAYRRDAARSLTLYGEQYRFIPVLGFQRGWRITEREVNPRPRLHGRSKFGLERYLRGLLDLVTVLFIGRYEYRPLHLFGGLGLLLMLAGTAICTVLSIEWFSGESIGRRPLLILGVLLIVVGVQFLTLGLVGELITAARQEARGRPARTSFVRSVSGTVQQTEHDRV
jgi:glycosyltransferase involved in cell wall biosynthesis